MAHIAGETGQRSRRARARSPGRPVAALVSCLAFVLVAAGFVAFVLWPRTLSAVAPDAPALPITIDGVLFNVPPAAIRVPLQRRAGSQERLDLAFLWPSLSPPDAAAKPALSEEPQPNDRLFATIARSDGTLGPFERLKTIYPRYLADEQFSGPDGLLIIGFRDGTPYQGEDLYLDSAAPERFMARCSRPGAGVTPGTCLFERRIGPAEITARFPRDWLADWRGVAAGIDRLIAQMQKSDDGRPTTGDRNR